LKNWGDFVSPEKKSVCDVYAQTSAMEYTAETNHETQRFIIGRQEAGDFMLWF
jgi:hypothetical protein